ncbi:toll/interleukin-1 receptor domain-containing protein [Dactylosporangium sp. CA-092794]|uniref:toll/interleukin-1 receptor domain-containing protein n=1 Tax=Dactylosporangium sp. CA-092794 TaxID=3239929 RepID=UPI003D8AEB27
MHHVFISYAREDTPAVREIAGILHRQGIALWVDWNDIPVSVKWWEEATKAIHGADLFVVCESPHSMASEPCRRELDEAGKTHKAIVIVPLADRAPAEAAALVEQAVRALPAERRTQTAVTVSADAWVGQHRNRYILPERDLLRQGLALTRSGRFPLPPAALEYLREGRRRRRWWWLRLGAAIGGAVVIGLVLLMTMVLLSFGPDTVASHDNSLASFIGLAYDESADPYTELRHAALLAQQGTGSVLRNQLISALSATVPDESWTSDAGFAAFGASTVSGDPQAVPGGPDPRALTRSADGSVQIRTTGAQTVISYPGRSIALPPANVTAVSADGTWALVVTAQAAQLYSLPKGTRTTVALPAHSYTAAALNGGTAIVGTDDGRLLTFAVNRAPAVASWTARGTSAVTGIAVSGDGGLVAVSARSDGAVHLLTGERLEQRHALVGGVPGAMAFSPGGRFLAVGTSADVVVFDAATGLLANRLTGSVGAVRDLAWSSDGSRVWALAGPDRVVGWPWRKGRVVLDEPGRSFVDLLGPGNDGRLAVVGGDGTVTVLDPAGTQVLDRVTTGATGALSAAWSADGTAFAIGTADGIRIQPTSGTAATISTGCPVTGVALSPDAATVSSVCGRDLRQYDVASGRLVVTHTLRAAATTPLRTARDGRVFFGNAAGYVAVFPAGAPADAVQIGQTCGLAIAGVAVVPSGTAVLGAGDGANWCGLEVYRRGGGAWQTTYLPPTSGFGTRVQSVAITGEGTALAFGRSTGEIDVWQPGPAGGNLLAAGVYREAGAPVRGMAGTADGTRLVIATQDGLVESLPGCPYCQPVPDLARTADAIVTRARGLGLYNA